MPPLKMFPLKTFQLKMFPFKTRLNLSVRSAEILLRMLLGSPEAESRSPKPLNLVLPASFR